MSWTYSGDPTTSQLDEVRFYTQDVVEARQFLQDQEINYLLDTWYDTTGSVIFVSAVACTVIAAKFASEVSVSADGVSVSSSELQQKYTTLAETLRNQAKQQLDDGVASGLNELWTLAVDDGLDPLMFGIGFNDNYEAGRQDYGDYSGGDAYSGKKDSYGQSLAPGMP